MSMAPRTLRGRVCRTAAPEGRETCSGVAFWADRSADADSGKVYAQQLRLTPWQTCLRKVPKHIVERPAERGARTENTLVEQNTLSGVKVMVIDDSNTIRRSAEIFLLQAGCTVILAEDGFDAWR